MNYPVLLIPCSNNTEYKVTVPDLPGCQIIAANIDLGLNEIVKTINEHLTLLTEYSEPIPTATSIDVHQKNYSQGIWAVINIDITPYLGKSHKINVTLPELLIKQIDERVNKSEAYKTRSGFIAKACLTELKTRTEN